MKNNNQHTGKPNRSFSSAYSCMIKTVCLFFVLFAGARAHAQTTTYTVTVRATGASGSHTTGHVTSTTVTEGSMVATYSATGSSNNMAFAVFNLSVIPTNAVVTSASLTYSVTAASGSTAATQGIYGYAGNIYSATAATLYANCTAGEQIYYSAATLFGPTTGSQTLSSTQTAQNFLQGNLGATVSLAWVSASTANSVTIAGETSTAAPALTIVYAVSNNYTTVPLASSSFNADVIANGSGIPSSTTNVVFASDEFVSGDYRYSTYTPSGTNHLPTAGKIASGVTTGLPYQFASYSSNNALNLNAGSVGTLTFTTPIYASNLFLLGTGGNFPTTVDIVANYADGSTQTFSSLSSYPDWFSGGSAAMTGVGRVSPSGAPDPYSTTSPYIYESALSMTTYGQKINSLTITNASAQEAFFAVSAQQGTLTTSVTSLSSFGACFPSASQTFSVSGAMLYPATTGSITVTAPSGFQVSNNNATWGTTTALTISGTNTLASVPVYVRFAPSGNGTYSGNITFSGGTVNNPPTVAVSGTAVGNVAVSPLSTANFGPVTIHTPSAAMIYTLSATGLSAGTVTVTTTNSDFKVSPDGTTWSNSYSFSNTATLSANVYIQYTPSVLATETATITVTGSAITCAVSSIACMGSGANNCTTPSGTPTSMVFTSTSSATTNVGFTTSGTPDGYLLVESPAALSSSPVNGTNYTTGSAIGTGTVIGTYTSLPTYAVSGLSANTQYYFTVIPFNGGLIGTCGGGPLYGTSLNNSMITCPATPATPTVSGLTSGGFTLNWSSVLGGGAASSLSYSIDISTNATFTSPITGSPFSVADPTTTLSVTSLSANTTYYYRITAVGGGTCNSPASTTGNTKTTVFTYNTATISSGFNADVIANGAVNPANGTLGVAGTSTGSFSGFDNSNYVYVASDYSWSGNTAVAATSLPMSGLLSSALTSGLTYQLASYSQNNALLLNAASAGSTGTLTLTVPQYASKIYLIGGTGSGGATGGNCTFTVHYADGTIQNSTTLNFPDWCYSTPTPAVYIGGRVNTSSFALDYPGAAFFEDTLSLTNLNSKVNSITVTTTAGGAGNLGVFAASARTGVLYPSASALSFTSTNVCSSSASQSFSITGNSLFPATTGTVTATASTGYQISTNGTTWGTTAVYTVSASNAISGTNVYVRFSPTTAGSIPGTITFVGAGINNAPTVTLSGTGVTGAITGTTSLCTGSTVTLSNIITGGTWSSSATGVASVSTAGVVAGRTAGTAVISYTYGCGATVNTATVTVGALPVISALTASSANICPSGTLTLTATETGGTGTPTYTWSGPGITTATGSSSTSSSFTPTVATTTSGAYSVSVVFTGVGCTSTVKTSSSVTVNATPTVTATAVSSSYCSGSSTGITASGASTYTWSPATGLSASTGATVTCNATATITYTITGTNASGCVSTATQAITVNALPVLTVTPVSSSYCSGSSTGITASGASTYSWSPATGLSASIGATVTCSAATTTTYTISGTNASGCVNTATQSITVNSLPVLTVTPVSSSICSGSSTGITASGASTYSWSPATGLSASTGATVTCSATATTTYTITGTNASGCVSTATKTITVNALPVLTVTPVSSSICSGSSTGITASGASTYSWSPATGLSASTGATVTCSATATNTYTITGTSALGCVSTGTQTITVNALPVLTVTPVSSSICSGSSTAITASGASTYSWSPATGLSASTGTPVTCSATATTTYTITGTNASGCVNTTTKTITVNAIPVLTVTPVSSSYCTGSSTGITASGASTYSWSPATGLSASTGATVTCSATATTTYTITGTNASGCVSTATQAITVNALPVLTVTPVSSAICSGSSTGITASGASSYSWSPATGLSASTGATVTCSATATNTYTITGTNASGCVSTGTQTITVNSLPVLTVTPVSSSICSGSSTAITASGASTYSWSPATGLSASTGTPVTCSATATTTYTITGTNASGCVNTTTKTITVNAIPVLTVTPVSSSYCTGSSTGITASGASTYSWSPATGLSASTGSAVTCNATATTTYTIAGTNGSGCVNTATKTITVNALPVLTVTPVSSAICSGSSTGITASGASTYNWSPATGLSATTGATVTCNTTSARTYTITGTNVSGCSSSTTQGITVNPLPVSGTISGTYTVCPAATASLSVTGTGGTWSSSAAGTATVSTSGVVRGIAAGTANISYAVTNSCGTATSYSVVTVNASPAAGTISGTYTVCPGLTTTLINTPGGGTWSSSAAGIATVNTSGVVYGVSAGTANISYAVTNGCGTATTYSVVSVIGVPSAGTISGSSAVCVASTISLTNGASGGTWSSSAPAVASINTSGVVSGIATGTANISYTVSNACGSSFTYSVITVSNQGTWLGTSSTDWNNTANWPCGLVPGATIDVTIPSGTTYAPVVVSGAAAAKSLTIASGVTLTINTGATIDVKNNLTNNGSIAGAGAVNLSGTSAQTLYGYNTINNLQLNNAAGATVNTGDTLKIKGTLTLTSGTLNTDNTLVLASDTSGTARIAAITGGAITGNVIVQQYITGGRRAYRFLCHPFNNYISLNQIEQYVDITGAGGSMNGFTTTSSNAPSSYWYNPVYGNSTMGSDPGWRAFTNTSCTMDSNKFKQYEGIRLVIRGSKGQGLTGATYTASPVTISMYGAVNTGSVSIPMVKGTGANADFNFIGNPYPSPVDLGTAVKAAQTAGQVTGGAYYVWNPYLGTSGQFVTAPIDGTPYYLEGNAAFEVRTLSNGSVMSFTESNKASSESAVLLRTAPKEYLTLNVYDTAYHMWDGMYVSFNDEATAGDDDQYDGRKPQGPASLNFYSLASDNTKMSLDARPYAAGKVIPLGVKSSYAQEFIIKADNAAIPAGGEVYLVDKYLNQSLKMQQGAEYHFTITGDSMSQGNSRFELRMGAAETAITPTVKGMNVQMMPNPATDEVTITYKLQGKEKVNLRLLDVSGNTILSKDLGTQQNGSTKLSLESLSSGIYMVEITSGSEQIVERLIKD